jgi:hypothetical protein
VSDFLVPRTILLMVVVASAMVFAPPSSLAAANCLPTASQGSRADNSGTCICHIGPVTIEVPVCEIKSDDYDDHVDHIDWENAGGIMQHIIVITPKQPRKFKGYLNEWWHHHKCHGEERRVGDPSRFEDAIRPGDVPPPQVTWTGCCAAPVCFIARAISVGKQIIELHVDVDLHYKMTDPTPEQIFSALLAQVRLSRPVEKPGSRSQH